MLILILILAALAIPLFSGAASVVLVACLCGVSVGVWLLYEMNSGRRQTRLTEIMTAALLTGYCGGCAITQSLCGLDQSGVTEAGFDAVPAAWVSYSITIVLAASALLLVAGRLEPALFRGSESITVGREEEWLIWLGLGIVVLEMLQGQFGYEGTTAQEGTLRVSFLGEMSDSFLLVILPLSTIGWVQASGFRRLRFGLIALTSLILTVPVGRRSLVYGLLVAIFAATRLSGVQLSVGRLARWLWGALAIGAIFVFTVLFLSLRIAVLNLGAGNHPLAQIVPETERVFQNPDYVLTTTKENLESRPFFLTTYLSLLTRDGNAPEPMYGADLNLSAKIIIPDIVFRFMGRSKDNLREIGTEEALANEHFHIWDADDANSILTGSVIDLGLLGIVIYPIGVCILWRIFLLDIEWLFGRKAALLLLLMALNTFLQAEMQLAGYFLEIRNGLIILAVWMSLRAIPSLRFTRDRRENGLLDRGHLEALPAGNQ